MTRNRFMAAPPPSRLRRDAQTVAELVVFLAIVVLVILWMSPADVPPVAG